MSDLRFEWDPATAVANARQHGVTFEEALTVFSDELGLLLDDPDHSAREERFVLPGRSATLDTLVVVHRYREARGSIRIIPARKASRLERASYEERWRA